MFETTVKELEKQVSSLKRSITEDEGHITRITERLIIDRDRLAGYSAAIEALEVLI